MVKRIMIASFWLLGGVNLSNYLSKVIELNFHNPVLTEGTYLVLLICSAVITLKVLFKENLD